MKEFVDKSPRPELSTEAAILCEILHERGIERMELHYSCNKETVEWVAVYPEDIQLPFKLQSVAVALLTDYAQLEKFDGGGYIILWPKLKGIERFYYVDGAIGQPIANVPKEQRIPRKIANLLFAIGRCRVFVIYDGHDRICEWKITAVSPEKTKIRIPHKLQKKIVVALQYWLPQRWWDGEGSRWTFTLNCTASNIDCFRFSAKAISFTEGIEEEVCRWCVTTAQRKPVKKRARALALAC